MKTGSTVRLQQPEIRGQVVERRIDPVSDEIEVLVAWEEDGERVQRWFPAARLEVLE
jgi:hypothetical protein